MMMMQRSDAWTKLALRDRKPKNESVKKFLRAQLRGQGL